MKKKIIKWLNRHGFIGDDCSIYRFNICLDEMITIDRKYRFRWQRMTIRLSGALVWGGSRKMVSARLPDAGQARDGINKANKHSSDMRLQRRIKERIILDADAGDLGDKTPIDVKSEEKSRIIKPD
jgi:hypothetical protein